jgi:hypothetical protein
VNRFGRFGSAAFREGSARPGWPDFNNCAVAQAPSLRLTAINAARVAGVRSPPQSTELTVALQIGMSTLIGCDTNPLGGVTAKLPQRGNEFPVEVSIA